MPFKRPAAGPRESSGHSSGTSAPPTPDANIPSKRSKVSQSAKVFPNVKVYIVQAKMDGRTIAELFVLAERHCERLCGDVEDADVIITSVTMRRRLERHVPWDVAVRARPITQSKSIDAASEKQSRGNTCMAARLCRRREAPCMRAVCRATRLARRDHTELPHLRHAAL